MYWNNVTGVLLIRTVTEFNTLCLWLECADCSHQWISTFNIDAMRVQMLTDTVGPL